MAVAHRRLLPQGQRQHALCPPVTLRPGHSLSAPPGEHAELDGTCMPSLSHECSPRELTGLLPFYRWHLRKAL